MEVEIKFLLSREEDFAKLLEALRPRKLKEELQINHFFDSPDHALQRDGLVCRLRIGTNSAEATIRDHTHPDGGSSLRFTESIKLSVPEAMHALSNPNDILRWKSPFDQIGQTHKVYTLERVGTFQNHRTTFACDDIVAPGGAVTTPGALGTLKLDRTSYEFGETYELEVAGFTEPASDVQTAVSRFLESIGISFRPSPTSKFERMISGKGQ